MKLRLGLIGDNIAASRAPMLHQLAGHQNGCDVTYERLVPAARNQTMEQIFDGCRTGGYRGLNITYPYKERVVPLLRIEDPLVRGMGAVNTVVFEGGGAVGYNTDYSGFVAGYRGARQGAATGSVLMIGTGGVGRAVAFGLAALGTTDLRLVDRDIEKAKGLALGLGTAAPDMQVTVHEDVQKASEGVKGVINCTPLGMHGYEGTPLAAQAMRGADWAFDAVYTPAKTQFLSDAASLGLAVISGWELFFYQGVHAWRLFSDLPLDDAQLRDSLLAADTP